MTFKEYLLKASKRDIYDDGKDFKKSISDSH